MNRPDTPALLDTLQPVEHFGERHERRIAAPPDQVWQAVQDVTFADMAVARALMATRALPGRRPKGTDGSHDRGRRLLDHLAGGGATELARGEREVVLGMIGQFWRLRPEPVTGIADGAAFRAFDRPGFAKVAVEVRAEPAGAGTLLVTRTRVCATDEGARRSFRRYWVLVRPFSGLIRRELLRAADHRRRRSVG